MLWSNMEYGKLHLLVLLALVTSARAVQCCLALFVATVGSH